MQDRIRINGEDIWQPDEGLKYSFETTYTDDSGRVIAGPMHATPLFTVEQFGYSAENVPMSEVQKILRLIIKGGPFMLHYYSMYYGRWRDDTFRVGKGSLDIMRLKDDEKRVKNLSFNMTGDNPI